MLGRRQELNLQFQQIIDGILLVIALWIAHVVRVSLTGRLGFDWSIADFSDIRWMLFVIMPFGPILLELQGYYQHPLQKTFARSVRQLLLGAIWLSVLLAGCVLFFRLTAPSRGVVIFFAVLSAVLLIARERISIMQLRQRAKSGRMREVVLLAGTPRDATAFRSTLTPEQLMEMEIVGEFDIENGPISALSEAMHKHSVSRVIFAGGHSHLNRLQEAIGACETEGVEAWIVADFIKTSIARPDFDLFGNRPMLVFRTTPAISWALMLKGTVDFIGALVLLVLTSPLFIIAAVGIKLTSPGPILFRQMRGGRHGRPFTMYKFRSMETNAEMRRAELAAFNEMSGPVFKVESDPRITPFGRWLRRTSIDELPQLINVLQGAMSLVGPRPLPIYEVEKFENTAQRRRLSVKPGLTCLWQVSGRNKVTSFQDWVKLDLEYIDNWSIWLDLKILLKTVPAVLFGSGAK
jgi:exopolysaccharide biosynthesis polyprenyl glycosylphosphotransferase